VPFDNAALVSEVARALAARRPGADDARGGRAPVRVLCGDVGGTRLRLGLAEVSPGRAELLSVREWPSGGVPGLAGPVAAFLHDVGELPGLACLAVAGPVVGGAARLPNLSWEADARALARETGLPSVRLVNDFHAVGHGLPLLGPGDSSELQAGAARPHAPVALVGAGTGLGMGFLTWADGEWLVHASEGGHADFAPATPLQWRLREHLARAHGHVSWERVVSGPGLVATHAFLAAERGSAGDRRPGAARAGRTGPRSSPPGRSRATTRRASRPSSCSLPASAPPPGTSR